MSDDRTVIVGCGIFGVAAALELQRRGARVTLVDAGPVPHPDASSTDISKAVRMDYGGDAFYTDLGERAIAGWHAWNREWPTPLYHEVGFLLLTRSPMRAGEFEAEGFRLLTSRNVPVERIDARLLARHPAWRVRGSADGYFNPRAGWVESGNVVARLAEQARAAGIELRTGARLAGWVEDRAGVRGVRLAGGDVLQGVRVVLAAGAWTAALLPELADRMWVTGQPVLHFRPVDPEPFRAERFPVWAADIARTGWYGFPLADGVVKVANHGSGRRTRADAPRSVSPEVEARCRSMLRETLPDLATAPLVGTRECLYCDTWDGDFWIDRHPGRHGLVVAAGGSGHAFKFGPVLGGIIADVVEGRPTPARFAWRERGERRAEAARGGDPPDP
jgi:glycine/D-amino acid oxidase-like deaminating enzyme